MEIVSITVIVSARCHQFHLLIAIPLAVAVAVRLVEVAVAVAVSVEAVPLVAVAVEAVPLVAVVVVVAADELLCPPTITIINDVNINKV